MLLELLPACVALAVVCCSVPIAVVAVAAVDSAIVLLLLLH